MTHVWVLDFDAENAAEGSDVIYQSVHATREAAGKRLAVYLKGLGVTDPAKVVVVSKADADNGSYTMVLEWAGWMGKINVGVHNMPVED